MQDGRQDRADGDGDDGFADTESERDQQSAGDQRNKIRESRDPQPGHIARRALALIRRDRLDPMGLDLEKLIGGSVALDHLPVNGPHVSLRWHYPDQVRGSVADWPPSQPGSPSSPWLSRRSVAPCRRDGRR